MENFFLTHLETNHILRIYRRLITTVSDFFFFNDTATTEIYTLSLHDALPISAGERVQPEDPPRGGDARLERRPEQGAARRSEEHTSELQSQSNLVCRLLLEKKIYMQAINFLHAAMQIFLTVARMIEVLESILA